MKQIFKILSIIGLIFGGVFLLKNRQKQAAQREIEDIFKTNLQNYDI